MREGGGVGVWRVGVRLAHRARWRCWSRASLDASIICVKL